MIHIVLLILSPAIVNGFRIECAINKSANAGDEMFIPNLYAAALLVRSAT
jgi:hypothetical protein